MLLNKKLFNYKNKNYLDEIIYEDLSIINIKNSDKLHTYTYTIDYDDFSLDYNIIDNNIRLISSINYQAITSIKIVQDLINLAQDLNIKSLEIQDNSFVIIDSCQYDLSIYSILLTGYPYYTRFGFISDNHDEEILYNKNIRNLPLNIFMKKTINEYNFRKIFTELCFDSPIKNIIKYINQYFEINNGKLKCNNPIIIFLLEIINKAKHIIKYNNILFKNF
jgi:hypothetical protein